MDFDYAAKRLQKDQSKLRNRTSRHRQNATSVKAKREAEARRKQQEQLRLERERKEKQLRHVQQYMTSCDRSLHVRSLGVPTTSTEDGDSPTLRLTATSIHGDGDKIALPPSILERLTAQGNFNNGSSPWMFRVAIPNPQYSFPASDALKNMHPTDDDMDIDNDDHDDMDDDDDDDGKMTAYLAELSEKYLAYSHATVVEFTQDEGHIGLPASIAAALLRQNNSTDTKDPHSEGIPTTRTIDPAKNTTDDKMTNDETTDSAGTPGHVAYGAFLVPAVPIEVSLVTLPKGKACTLVPTKEAVVNGFYRLKDVKLVLEQSLIRTRATLSVGDNVHTWHRGVKYDLTVTTVSPPDINAVSCINTDIEVDIGEVEGIDEYLNDNKTGTTTGIGLGADAGGQQPAPIGKGRTLKDISSSNNNDNKDPFASSKGQRLSDPPTLPTSASSSSGAAAISSEPMDTSLPPEPPADQKEGVCTVQVRSSDGSAGRRRFHVKTATKQHLFAFASTVAKLRLDEFRLVARFPRRVIALQGSGDDAEPLANVGIQAGQEMLMVEKL